MSIFAPRGARSLAALGFLSLAVSPARSASFAPADAAQLEAAIATSNSNSEDDTITLSGTYTLGAELSAIGEASFTTTIEGSTATPSDTIVQANVDPFTATFRVFAVSSVGSATFRNMTIRHGRLSGGAPQGGGILNQGALTLENVVLTQNVATAGPSLPSRGGGLYCASGTLVLVGCTVSLNVANAVGGDPGGNAFGGGVYIAGNVNAVVSHSTFNGNVAAGGAGVNFPQPAGDGQGGAFFIENSAAGTTRIFNCTISGNTANGGSGGGASDTTDGIARGAGIAGSNHATNVNPIVEFCTIAGNFVGTGRTGGFQGAGVSSGGSNDDQGMRLINTIVANNADTTNFDPNDIHGNILSSGFNLVESTAGGTLDDAGTGVDGRANSGTGNVLGTDPNLGGLANNGGGTNTMALLGPPNAAYNAANGQTVDGMSVPSDQRGVARPQNGASDIGAFESATVVPVGLSEVGID